MYNETDILSKPKEIEKKESKQQPKEQEGTVVNCSQLNVRATPSLTGTIITAISKGSYVKILRPSKDGWTRVYTGSGMYGYVMSDYIEVV